MHRRALTIIMGLCMITSIAHAEDFFSASFHTLRPTANSYGGIGTSTSFSSILSGGQTVTGESTSTSFIVQSGILYFDSTAPYSQRWRWYDDETNETPTSPLAAENTAPPNMSETNSIKLRITVKETSTIEKEGAKFRLQFATSSQFTNPVFVAEQGGCTGASGWCYANGGGVDNAVISTALISDADACAGGVGDGCGTHNESGTSISSFMQTAGATTEYEFTIVQSGATPNTVYFFRLFDVVSSTTVPTNTGETNPSLSTEGGLLTFTIDGLEAATSTEGITTDVETTATSVPFGTLSLNTAYDAAQRLTVSTNANQGYKIFAFQRQGLLGPSPSTEIPPVTGTNSSPSGWAAGCTGGAAGCYGYHSGEDVLEGGSTRFAANDTYARFTDEPQEIAYSATQVNEKVTDIVYRVEARQLQAAGSYSTTLVYIVTPVF